MPSEQEIAETEKDSKNTQKAIEGCRFRYDEYLKENHIRSYPETANELATVLKKFYAEVRKSDFDNSFMFNWIFLSFHVVKFIVYCGEVYYN